MTTPSASLSRAVLTAMRDVAARIIMPRYTNLKDSDVRSKNHPGDLVTIADEEAERDLTRMFLDLLPGSKCVGEEAVAKTPTLIENLSSDAPVWIIDPIDGTANFVNGRPRFAVMVALVRGGETVMGWIHDPVTGHSLWAELGAGTWLQTDKGTQRQMIQTQDGLPLSELIAELHHPDFNLHKGKFARITRLGSAAHDYWAMADGRMQVLCYRRIKPWDHAAGVLIHAEAGGYNGLLSGQPYNPCIREQAGLLCAPSADVWEKVAGLRN